MPNGLVALLAGLGGGSTGILEQRERDAVQRARDAALQQQAFGQRLEAAKFRMEAGPRGYGALAASLDPGAGAATIPSPTPRQTAAMPTPGAGDGGLSALAPAAGAGAMSDGMGGLGGMARGPATQAIMGRGQPAAQPAAPGNALAMPATAAVMSAVAGGKRGPVAALTGGVAPGAADEAPSYDQFLATHTMPSSDPAYHPGETAGVQQAFMHDLQNRRVFAVLRQQFPGQVPEHYAEAMDYASEFPHLLTAAGKAAELAQGASQFGVTSKQKDREIAQGDRRIGLEGAGLNLRGQEFQHTVAKDTAEQGLKEREFGFKQQTSGIGNDKTRAVATLLPGIDAADAYFTAHGPPNLLQATLVGHAGGNAIAGQNAQLYQTHATTIGNAVKRTFEIRGLAAPDDATIHAQYIPAPGDTPAQLAAKAVNRADLARTARAVAGPALSKYGGEGSAPEQGVPVQGAPIRRTTPAPAASGGSHDAAQRWEQLRQNGATPEQATAQVQREMGGH